MPSTDSPRPSPSAIRPRAPAEAQATTSIAARGLLAGSRAVLLYGMLLAVALGLSIAAYQYQRFPGDLPIAEWVQSISIPGFGDLMEAVSVLGDWTAAAIMTTTVVIALWFLRRRADVFYLVLLLVASTALNRFVKVLVDRPRPDSSLLDVVGDAGGKSFPSGHTVYAATFFGFLFLCGLSLQIGHRWARWAVQALLALLILAMGMSRVYLGAHWPSDVVGAYVFGALYLLAIMWLRGRFRASDGAQIKLPGRKRS